MRVKILVAFAVAAASPISALLLPDLTGSVVPEQYLVVFKDGVSDSAVDAHYNWIQSEMLPSPKLHIQGGDDEFIVEGKKKKYEGYGIKRQYNFGNFKGYSAKLPKDAAKDLEAHPDIDYVEIDRIMSITGSQNKPASWGLQRISARDLPLTAHYEYPDSAGEGVNAYIVDTGIHISHPEFEGRAKIGKTFVKDNDKDGNGHGSHVAGTIGSKSYGVAKKVNLIAVKVLDGRGYGDTSGVIAGIEYVATEGPKSRRKAVANMSLGGPSSRALDRAVQAAVKAGVVFVVAAGNSAGDACKLSPAGVAEAITVAASDKYDKIASFSETGKCVDIIAPGVDITSTWNNGGTNTISGTSMASPHVAGVVALALAEGNFTSPKEVQDYLKAVSSKDKIKGNLKGAPNNFLYNNVVKGSFPDDEPREPKPAPEYPEDPDEPSGECPIPQCIFDPKCTGCCIDC